MKTLWPGAGLLLIIVTLALWVELKNQPQELPDITLTNLQGGEISLAALRHQPVLVSFWATTCASCMKEMPLLAALYRELHPQGLQVIAVAMPYDRPDRVLAMSREQQYPFPVALDPQGLVSRAFGDIQVTPTWFLSGTDGRIVRQHSGPLDIELIKQQVSASAGFPKHLSLR